MKSCHRWLSRFINQSTRLVPSSCGKHKNFSTERKLNVAVIGGGRIGQVHMETLSFHTPLAKPVMIVDFIEKVAKSTAEKFGVEKYSTDFKDVLKDPNIEAVWICSPSSQHSEQIKALASAGKHIFCEKPLAITLKEAEEVTSAVEKAKVKMMLAFQRRFDPNFARAKQCIQSGAVGDVYAVHLISRDPAPPPMDYIKNSGGLHNDMAIHDFDIARFMTGSECEEITAYGACRVDPKIASEGNDIDTAITLLKFKNGAFCTIDNCRQSPSGYDQRVEVFGSKGLVRFGNNFPNNVFIEDAQSVRRSDLPFNFFMDRYTEAYRNETKQFVQCVLENKEPPTSGRDGTAAMAMAIAAKKSLLEKRAVKLSEITP
jgi:myo-inositol 2-dehydrogenase/D-chiro-inositol 1-dehydrogenase